MQSAPMLQAVMFAAYAHNTSAIDDFSLAHCRISGFQAL
jgi:hypothetical protein